MTDPPVAISTARSAATAGIGDDGAGLTSGLERAIGLVGSVGEGLGHEAEAGVCGGGRHRLRGRQPEQQQVAAEAADRPGNGRCERRIRCGLVVERAVRLDVLHLHAVRPTERLESPDLVPHEGLDLVRLEGHRPPAEPEQIRVAGLRAHGHTRPAAQRDRRLHDPEVAGVEAAGEVRAGEVRHEPLVVAERPAPVALAEVGVEVHSGHPTAPLGSGRRIIDVTDSSATEPIVDEPTPTSTDGSSSTPAIGLGVALLLIGGLLFVGQLLDIGIDDVGWPAIVIGIGVVILVLGLFVNREQGMVIGGTVVTTVGLVLLYQDQTGRWETWAYAWALVGPAASGLGMVLWGIRSADPVAIRNGTWALLGGLAIFVVGFLFFEGVIGISGEPLGLPEWVLPVVVIAIGVVVLARGIFDRRDPERT